MSFLGRGWSFPPRFSARSRGVEMVEGEADIAESLRILMSTHVGERLMQPAYGCRLRELVFEAANEQTLTELRDMLTKAILFFEPRITLEFVDARISDLEPACLELSLHYSVRSTNTRHNLVYPLYLQQATSPMRAD
ncbi:GPW/gp25 family protein [Roseateles cavernae]|uniref:GPW/gp25 family protein n=1 Tax=Roseateles cavernae TaxID=3153578 RepID=UPI0032E41DD4